MIWAYWKQMTENFSSVSWVISKFQIILEYHKIFWKSKIFLRELRDRKIMQKPIFPYKNP